MITTLLVALKVFLRKSFQLRVMLLNMFFSLREEHPSRRKQRPLNKKEVLSTMAKDVKDLWIKASISQLFGEKYLRRKICRNLNQYKSAVKALLSIGKFPMKIQNWWKNSKERLTSFLIYVCVIVRLKPRNSWASYFANSQEVIECTSKKWSFFMTSANPELWR